MDFDFNEQQRMVGTSARELLASMCSKDKVRELEKDKNGYAPALLAQMAELGWTGLIIPEQYGGAGAGLLDLVVLMEEMGRNILPGPFFSTVAQCSIPILKFGTKAQKGKYLRAISEGKTLWSLALTEKSGRSDLSDFNCAATLNGKNYVINGEKWFVPYAHIADYLLVLCRMMETEDRKRGLTLFVAKAKSSGINIELIPTVAGDGQCRIKFRNVVVGKDDIIGKLNRGGKVANYLIQRATVLKCAEVSGACQAVLDMTQSYARERVQFGKSIGSFMAIQHELVDMLIEVEALQYLVHYAAWLLSSGAKADAQVSMAKAKSNEVYQRMCINGIRIHGAIGFTMDHDIGCYFRRVKSAEFMLGDTGQHLEEIAVGIGL